MMTVDGLFGAGDTLGGAAHKFSSGSFAEGRIAAKAAVNYVNDLGRDLPQVSEAEYEDLKKTVYQPLENYEVGRNEIVAGTVSPSLSDAPMQPMLSTLAPGAVPGQASQPFGTPSPSLSL